MIVWRSNVDAQRHFLQDITASKTMINIHEHPHLARHADRHLRTSVFVQLEKQMAASTQYVSIIIASFVRPNRHEALLASAPRKHAQLLFTT